MVVSWNIFFALADVICVGNRTMSTLSPQKRKLLFYISQYFLSLLKCNTLCMFFLPFINQHNTDLYLKHLRIGQILVFLHVVVVHHWSGYGVPTRQQLHFFGYARHAGIEFEIYPI